MKVVVIIPARGGSKGVPRKNVRLLAGKPLIHYSIMEALRCRAVDKVVVSTEDDEIAEASRAAGAEVINRPKALADDNVATLPVLVHAVKHLEKTGYVPDIIVLMYATAPLVKSHYVEEGIKKMMSCDSVISVCEDTRNYKLWEKRGNSYKPLFKKRIDRQKVPKLYRENGAFYIMFYDTLMKKKSITGKKTKLVFMKPEESIDINTTLDFAFAETIMRNKISNSLK